MEITGTVYEVNNTMQVSEKFKKRDLIILTDPTSAYPQYVTVQLSQDKCDLANGLTIGQEVVAHINIKGRKWRDKDGATKFFNTIECWRLVSTPLPKTDIPVTAQKGVGPTDDLPF